MWDEYENVYNYYMDKIYDYHEISERTNNEILKNIDKQESEKLEKMEGENLNWWEKSKTNKDDFDYFKDEYNIFFYDDNDNKNLIIKTISKIENNDKLNEDEISFLFEDFRLTPVLSNYYERAGYHSSDFDKKVECFSKACSVLRVYSKILYNKNKFDNCLKEYNIKKFDFIFKSIELSKKAYEIISRLNFDEVKNINNRITICSYLNTKTAAILDLYNKDEQMIEAKKLNKKSLKINKFNYQTWRVKARIHKLLDEGKKAKKTFQYAETLKELSYLQLDVENN